MEILVNGELKMLDNSQFSISDILKVFDVEMPDMVSVQLNGIFVERPFFTSTFVKNRDEIEFLYFMGGGRT